MKLLKPIDHELKKPNVRSRLQADAAIKNKTGVKNFYQILLKYDALFFGELYLLKELIKRSVEQ